MTACENDRQQFDLAISAMNVSVKDTVYSFAVKPSVDEQDTVPLYIGLIGEIKDYPRTFKLQATPASRLTADHYRLPELVLPAFRAVDTLNLIFIKKTDLKDTTFLLELEIASDGELEAGINRKIRIHVGDELVIPSNWEADLEIFFGTYSQVKHTLIIEATGYYDYSGLGLGTKKNLAQMTKNHLAELNDLRAKEGKGPLEDELGRIVVIGSN